MKADVLIIGSGISGLTAAAILTAKGRKVVIVEKQPRIGGALKRFKRGNIPFDVGFHYTGCLGQGQVLDLLWQYCNILHRLKILPFPSEGHDRLYINGHPRPVQAYFSSSRFADELRCQFPNERQAIELYFRKIRQICRLTPFYNTSLPLTDFLQGYKPKAQSLSEFLKKISNNPSLQAAFAASSILYGVPTDQVSIDVHALVVHGYYNGAYGITGGGQAIIDAFHARLQESDTMFLTDRSVNSILVDAHGVTGIVTDKGEFVQSRHVIYTGHPAALVGMVPESCFRPAYKKRLCNLKNTLSMFALFGTIAATSKSGSALAWTNHICLPAGPNPLPASPWNPSRQRPLMLTCAERTPDNTLRPGPKSVILLQPALWEEVRPFHHCRKGERTPAYSTFKHEITNEMLRIAEQQWGNFLGPIQPLAIGTPLTFRDELSAPEGCAYGAMHCLDQFNPQPRTRVPGLLLSGQSTLMTGVVGASISGMVSAGEILGLESLWREIRQWN